MRIVARRNCGGRPALCAVSVSLVMVVAVMMSAGIMLRCVRSFPVRGMVMVWMQGIMPPRSELPRGNRNKAGESRH